VANEFDYLKYMDGIDDREQVFHELMDSFGTDVWNFVYSLTCSADAADDISQNTFLQVYRHLHKFKGHSSIKTWILAIARNQTAEYRRSAFFRRVRLVPDAPQAVHRWHPSAESEAIDKLEAGRVWSAVLRLPAKLKEVLVLHSHHRLPVKEIAQLLKMSEGTVKSRLSRARAKTERLLKEENRDER